MPNVAAVLKEEIVRLAKKQVREQIGPLRKSNVQLRKAVASLKRENAELQRRLLTLEKGQRGAATSTAPKQGKEIRFSPGWVVKDRERLELSAKDYATLVGVSQLTVYNWEKGKSRPRRKQLEAWARVRGLGKKAAWAELER